MTGSLEALILLMGDSSRIAHDPNLVVRKAGMHLWQFIFWHVASCTIRRLDRASGTGMIDRGIQLCGTNELYWCWRCCAELECDRRPGVEDGASLVTGAGK